MLVTDITPSEGASEEELLEALFDQGSVHGYWKTANKTTSETALARGNAICVRLLERIAALREENERLRQANENNLDGWMNDRAHLMRQLDEARAELTQAKLDLRQEQVATELLRELVAETTDFVCRGHSPGFTLCHRRANPDIWVCFNERNRLLTLGGEWHEYPEDGDWSGLEFSSPLMAFVVLKERREKEKTE